ncbi:DUF3592 domain-containing protein [Rubellicoccus peritrichatus]|uniref:DUF3592 domain-containing protein n=1 Tax=Rubellicoccus peritrichatus TaxID=3080537 RepID=A0AAQ3QX98_9BACT|nr:DUF3592 domain-containing protein [Puniceicoccus sp. CR14]WOO42660.1 DUF3592 domain-containing protein [Puniceicoccus sp. CR14]
MKTEFIEVEPKTGLLIGSVMILAGILFTGWKINRIFVELSTYSWIQTTAEMHSAEFDTQTRSSGSGVSYHGDFNYSYFVDGQEYFGNRYDAKGRMQTGLKKQAREFEENLKVSASVPVYYDPEDPSSSLLKKGITEDTSVRFVFSLFLVGVGLFTIRYQLKRMAKQDPGQHSPIQRPPFA